MTFEGRAYWGVGAALLAGVVAWIAWPSAPPAPAPEPQAPPPPPGPCDVAPDVLGADLLAGPYESFDAACEAWADGSCERIETAASDHVLPYEELSFVRRPVSEDEAADKAAIGLAVRYAGRWWMERDVSQRYEDHGSHAIAHREREGKAPILLLEARFERRFHHGTAPDGPVQVISRDTVLMCSVGDSGKPSCTEIPVRWRRETRRPDQEPDDVAESVIAHTWCESGDVLIEGSTERLSTDNQRWVERIVGLNRPTFP